MNLIIVESPTKARTLTKFLKGKYTVEATMGHIRDLPKSKLGVDVEHNFEPSYIIPTDKKKRVGELKAIAKGADAIILATDPDREGEAIAFHVAEILKTAKKITFSRIVFHEITEKAIQDALEHPRSIDQKLVNAQQARRILDRLVGYKLSPVLWQKLSKRWLSAGRVQSVAVRLIVEREREIAAFTKEPYWTIEGNFGFIAELISKDGKKYEQTITLELFDGKYTTTKTTIKSADLAKKIIADFMGPFTVKAVDTKEVKRHPQPPYTTSTMQQDAGRKLYFSAKRTMQLAQKLYEEGFITYHRTDSVNLSDTFVGEVRSYIADAYGKEYLPDVAKIYLTKSKVAQEAHEAIRPTDTTVFSLQSSVISQELNKDHLRLYELIWKRAVASQVSEAVFDSTRIDISSANQYLFQAQGSVIKFDGYLRIMGRDSDDTVIPKVAVGESVKLVATTPISHETAPPPRYTEASLVKTLEEKDIGRPSTYAPIISTIQDRQYVIKEDLPAGRQGKKLVPTELGIAVVSFLVKYFSDIMDLPFTARMEGTLDAIANGQIEWVPAIAAFYTPFAQEIAKTLSEAEKVKVVEEKLDEACPTCGNPLVLRMGRYGKFVACSTFPACTYTRQFTEKIGRKCPRCGGDIVVKKTHKGKTFYGCSNYPTCTFAAWKKEDIK